MVVSNHQTIKLSNYQTKHQAYQNKINHSLHLKRLHQNLINFECVTRNHCTKIATRQSRRHRITPP